MAFHALRDHGRQVRDDAVVEIEKTVANVGHRLGRVGTQLLDQRLFLCAGELHGASQGQQRGGLEKNAAKVHASLSRKVNEYRSLMCAIKKSRSLK